MPNNASSSSGSGGSDLLRSVYGKSHSTESLTNPPGAANITNNTRKPAKVNELGIARKLNTKIQAMSGKLTEIIVWSTTLHESTLPLDRSRILKYIYIYIVLIFHLLQLPQ